MQLDLAKALSKFAVFPSVIARVQSRLAPSGVVNLDFSFEANNEPMVLIQFAFSCMSSQVRDSLLKTFILCEFADFGIARGYNDIISDIFDLLDSRTATPEEVVKMADRLHAVLNTAQLSPKVHALYTSAWDAVLCKHLGLLGRNEEAAASAANAVGNLDRSATIRVLYWTLVSEMETWVAASTTAC